MKLSLTWRHWAWASAIAALISLAQLPMFMSSPMFNPWAKLSAEFPRFLAFSYIFMLAIVTAESGISRGSPMPLRRTLVALAVACSLCLAAMWFFPVQPARTNTAAGNRIAEMYESGARDKRRYTLAWLGSVTVMNGILATFVYVWLRNSRLSARAMTQAQAARTESERRLVASRLEATQAEINPALVLGKLADIERTYETDRFAADAMLDALIAFLRASIPKVRAQESRREKIEG
jgi:hypothetical protein